MFNIKLQLLRAGPGENPFQTPEPKTSPLALDSETSGLWVRCLCKTPNNVKSCQPISSGAPSQPYAANPAPDVLAAIGAGAINAPVDPAFNLHRLLPTGPFARCILQALQVGHR